MGATLRHEEHKVHHTYQLKQENITGWLRDLHHSISANEISDQLSAKGHTIRNIINVRNRVSTV